MKSSKEMVLSVYPGVSACGPTGPNGWCQIMSMTPEGGRALSDRHQYEDAAWDDAASRLTETKLPSSPAGASETTLITECCLRAIADDERFCPRCGWEARVLEERLPSAVPYPLGADISGPKGSGGAAEEAAAATNEECCFVSPDGFTCRAYAGHCGKHGDGDGHEWPTVAAPAAVSEVELIRELGSIADDSAAIHDSMVGRDSGISTLAGRCCDAARSIIASLAKPSAEVAAPIAPAAQEDLLKAAIGLLTSCRKLQDSDAARFEWDVWESTVDEFLARAERKEGEAKHV